MSFGSAGGILGILGLGIQGVQTGLQAGARYAEIEANNKAIDWNAGILNKQAGNNREAAEIERALGKKEAADVRRDGRKIIGTQRAITGASGVKVDVGSSADLAADTAKWNEYDAQIAMYNRNVNAYKLDNEANNLDLQASMTRAGKHNPKLAALGIGLSGTSNIMKSYGGW